MDRICELTLRVCLALITIFGISWILGIPDYLQWTLITAEFLGIILGLGVCAVMIKYPYGERAGGLDLGLGVAGLLVWLWMSYNLEEWLMLMADRTPDMWVPGIVAVVLMMEGLRKAAGKVIAIVVWTLIVYAFSAITCRGSSKPRSSRRRRSSSISTRTITAYPVSCCAWSPSLCLPSSCLARCWKSAAPPNF